MRSVSDDICFAWSNPLVQNFERTPMDTMLKMFGGRPLLVRWYAACVVLMRLASFMYPLMSVRLEL